MKVLAKVTIVVDDEEYAPNSPVDIPNEKEAKSLIARGFASALAKVDNSSANPPATPTEKDDKKAKTDKNTQKSAKSDKNGKKNEENSKKENDSSGSTISKSGGQSV